MRYDGMFQIGDAILIAAAVAVIFLGFAGAFAIVRHSLGYGCGM